MRLITIILSLFLFLGANLAQGFCAGYHLLPDTVKNKTKIRHVLTSAEIQASKRHYKDFFDNCVFTNKYRLAERLKKYPFSQAKKVVAVSYPSLYLDTITRKENDTMFKERLNIRNGKLYYSSLTGIKTLNIKQISRLTNIIYNTDYKVHYSNSYMEGACFEPRNALIFYDKNGKIFDYIEICFRCLNSESHSERITIGTLCTQKYDLLKAFFNSIGVK